MTLTIALLNSCTGTIHATQAQVDAANEACHLYNLSTVNRVGMFLANVGHETGGLRFNTELWGPTPAQQTYDTKPGLGNLYIGDGFKYRGRGWLQITGRANYLRLTQRLQARWPQMLVPDFVLQPDLLAQPEWCAVSAADFWEMNNISKWADVGDFDAVCDVINKGHHTPAFGDSNGWKDRYAIWKVGGPALAAAGFPITPGA